MCASGDAEYCVLTAALLQWVLRGAVGEAVQNCQPWWRSKVRITLVLGEEEGERRGGGITLVLLIPLLLEYAS